MKRKKIIIDTDPAIGVFLRDVDDALAILLAIASPEIELEGITINFGNVPSEKGYTVGKQILAVAGVDIPIIPGAASRKLLGRPTPAVEHLIQTVNRHPGEITLVAVAPLTNVASAMMLDNTFAGNLNELIVMGGAVNFKFFSTFGELNFHLDGQAASIVMAAPCHKTLLTMDLCSQAVFTRSHLAQLKGNKTAVSQFLARNIPSWLTLNRIVFRKGGFFPWDPIAVACAINPDLTDKKHFTFDVQAQGIRSGRIYNLKEQAAQDDTANRYPVNIPQRLDSKHFMKMLLDHLLSL